MQKRENFLPFFLVFFTLSLVVLLLGRLGLLNFLFSVGRPVSEIRSHTLGILSLRGLEDKEIKLLKEENQKLTKALVDQENLKNENKALRAQFETTFPSSSSLLPAKVIASPGFIPGISVPDFLIIDKGTSGGVSKGSSIVLGSYLIGKVIETTPNSSKIELVSSPNSTFTAKIAGIADSSGIIKGKGSGKMLLDNVLLTLTLKKDAMILTKGGEGFPPDLLVGKVISVEKKSSDLFQKAEVKSSVDFSNLELVFVIK